ncbi:MAG: DUF2225 domain-containing protein [Ekhidna sp.]
MIYINDLHQGYVISKDLFLLIATGIFFTASAISIETNWKISVVDILLVVFGVFLVMNRLKVNQPFPFLNISLWEIGVLIFFITAQYVKRFFSINWVGVIWILMVGLFVNSVIGIGQMFNYIPQSHITISGYFFNPAPFAAFLLIWLMPLLTFSIVSRSKIKYLSTGISILTIAVIILTLSRAALLGVIISLFFFVALTVHISKWNFMFQTTRHKISLILVSVIISMIAVIVLARVKPESVEGRILNWKITGDIIAQQPLLGIGFDLHRPTFGLTQANYFRTRDASETEIRVAGKGEYVFNEWIRVFCENGIIGGFLLIIPIIIILYKGFLTAFDKRDYLILGFTMSLTSICVFACFSYPFSISPLLISFFIVLAMVYGMTNWKTLFVLEISYVIKIVMVLFGIVWVSYSLHYAYKNVINYRLWKKARNEVNHWNQVPKARLIMDEIALELGSNGDFLLDYGQVLRLDNDCKKSIEVLNQAKQLTSDPYLFTTLGDCYKEEGLYTKAEESYQHAYYLMPHKFYPLYLLAKLYESIQENEKAISIAREILQKDVKVQSTAIVEIKQEMETMLKNIQTSK